jgi:hypothetical protein
MNNPKLHTAMKRYVLTGIGLVRDRCQPEEEEEEQWVPSGTGYVLQRVTRQAWWLCLHHEEITDELHALPAYAALVAALKADPVIAPQLDTLVGTEIEAGRLELRYLTDSVITGCLLQSSGATEDEQVFEARYAELEARLYAQEIHQEELVLLAGFSSAVLPLRLREGVEIVQVTPEHIQMALRLRLLPVQGMTGHSFVLNPPSHAIRQTWSLPKRIGEQDDSTVALDAQLAASIERREISERAIAAVRLFQEGQIFPVAMVARAIDPPPAGGGGYQVYPMGRVSRFFPSETYRLTEAQAPQFVRFWQWLDSVGGPVALASRRFSDARERVRTEDQILDLVIAAEALFGAGETQEVSYKVRLRAAAFLGSDATSRQRVFDEFKAAYDARSLIAHGGTPTRKQKQQIDRLPDLIKVMDGHVRASIQKAANLSEWPSTHSAWDTAVLGSLGSLNLS